MRISFNWLKRYIDIKRSPQKLADIVTGIGLEVESIEVLGKEFEGFVIGEVVDVKKHPNADRLSVCSVKINPKSEPHQIVCGAPNVAPGQKVIVGLPGAVVPHNQHDSESKPFTLSKTAIRGVESNGMICSAHELGLGDDKSGIMVLDSKANVGIALSHYLGLNDVAFELGITPNRPDCLCHIGVARDIAAATDAVLQYPKTSLHEKKSSEIKKIITVSVKNTTSCPRYSVRVVKDIKVEESPAWLKSLLTAAGLRPINNIVDITNFVMLECGQPLHAFDYDTLVDHTIIVKDSTPGEKFTTLDNQEHTLDGSELMICDGEKPVAMAGVMGGANSEISATTTTVALESAYFLPASVRKTARKHGFSTDASYRFERGIDPNGVVNASERAAQLISEICGGTIVGGCLDVYPYKIKPKKIRIRVSKVKEILGIDIPHKTITSILHALEISTERSASNGALICTVPTFRPDIEQEIDLVEEIARHFGYDNIPDQVTGNILYGQSETAEERIHVTRTWLESNGFNEIITDSLIDKNHAVVNESTLRVKNPLSTDHEYLRSSLLPTMLRSVSYNFNHGADRIQMFEVGTIFHKSSELQKSTFIEGFYEQNTLGICLSGFANELHWTEKQRHWDIFDLKGIVASLLQSLGIDNIHLIYYDASSSLTESAIRIEINNTYVGFMGKCSGELLSKFKIDSDVYYAEINLDAVTGFPVEKKFSGYSKFPTVMRDVAFIVDKGIHVGEIEKTIKASGSDILTGIVLFDIFTGESLGADKKSVAFSLRLNSREKTLTDQEIDIAIKDVVSAVTSKHKAILRSI